MIAEAIIKKISGLTKIEERELSVGTELYNSVVISSLGLMEVMRFVEDRFEITIEPEDLIEDNFRDVGTLAKFVSERMAARTEHLE